MIETNKERLGSLQVGRAIAALAVVGHHASLSARELIRPITYPFQEFFEFGWFGVDFFFVLSGFIIYHSTQKSLPGWKSAKIFATNRAIRVYTPYIPISISLIILYIMLGSNNDRTWNVFSSITLLPSKNVPALSVAWTLQHELVFYILFAIGFFTRRLALILFLWTSAIFASIAAGFSEILPYSVGLSLINIEFIFGIMVAAAFKRKILQGSYLPYVASIAAILIWYVEFDLDRSASVLGGGAIAALMLPIVYWDSNISQKFNRFALQIGSGSYAIYLVHNPLISITTRIAARLHIYSTEWMALSMGIIVSVAVGIAYHSWFEVPATRLLRHYAKNRSRSPVADLAGR